MKCIQVKICCIPHLKGLIVGDLRAFGEKKTNLNDYLPDYGYHKIPNIQWLWNVLNTLLCNTFAKLVQEYVHGRVKHIMRKKDVCVKVLLEFAEKFKISKNVLVQKGNPHCFSMYLPHPKYEVGNYMQKKSCM